MTRKELLKKLKTLAKDIDKVNETVCMMSTKPLNDVPLLLMDLSDDIDALLIEFCDVLDILEYDWQFAVPKAKRKASTSVYRSNYQRLGKVR